MVIPSLGRSTHLVIRLSLRGCTNRPFYHIVLMKNRQGRDEKCLDQLGAYDPMPNIHDEVVVSMDFDKLRKYMSAGYKPSKPVLQLLGLCGYLPIHPTTRLQAYRLTRKAEEAMAMKESEGKS